MDIFKKLLASAKIDKENIRTKMRYVWLTIARDSQFEPLTSQLDYNKKFEEYFELVNDGSQRNLHQLMSHRQLIDAKADECLALVEAFVEKNNIVAVTHSSAGISQLIG